MPDTDNHAESGQAPGLLRSLGISVRAWLSSLWLWPATAILLSGIAGTAYGETGALLAGSEVLATFALAAGILVLGRDRFLAIGLACALTVSLATFGAFALGQNSHHKSDRPRSTAYSFEYAVDWQRQKISQAMVKRANFRGADLDGANLNGLQLSHKNFDGAKADGATFRGSELEYASFRGASLRGACLEGANLTGADLTDADFTGADVAGVTVLPQAVKAALVWPGPHSIPGVACQR